MGDEPFSNTNPLASHWIADFDDRQRQEIMFAGVYAENYHHGTDGHNRLMLIWKLAAKLCQVENELHWLKVNQES